mmetsp:Transcript_33422/g.79691  ORF Transcript_33422/g.79691 Transcript_33422/m.79691 type:complete len:297 (-) Transcript_33422:858-1748(-)
MHSAHCRLPFTICRQICSGTVSRSVRDEVLVHPRELFVRRGPLDAVRPSNVHVYRLVDTPGPTDRRVHDLGLRGPAQRLSLELCVGDLGQVHKRLSQLRLWVWQNPLALQLPQKMCMLLRPAKLSSPPLLFEVEAIHQRLAFHQMLEGHVAPVLLCVDAAWVREKGGVILCKLHHQRLDELRVGFHAEVERERVPALDDLWAKLTARQHRDGAVGLRAGGREAAGGFGERLQKTLLREARERSDGVDVRARLGERNVEVPLPLTLVLHGPLVQRNSAALDLGHEPVLFQPSALHKL